MYVCIHILYFQTHTHEIHTIISTLNKFTHIMYIYTQVPQLTTRLLLVVNVFLVRYFRSYRYDAMKSCMYINTLKKRVISCVSPPPHYFFITLQNYRFCLIPLRLLAGQNELFLIIFKLILNNYINLIINYHRIKFMHVSTKATINWLQLH